MKSLDKISGHPISPLNDGRLLNDASKKLLIFFVENKQNGKNKNYKLWKTLPLQLDQYSYWF